MSRTSCRCAVPVECGYNKQAKLYDQYCFFPLSQELPSLRADPDTGRARWADRLTKKLVLGECSAREAACAVPVPVDATATDVANACPGITSTGAAQDNIVDTEVSGGWQGADKERLACRRLTKTPAGVCFSYPSACAGRGGAGGVR